MAEKYRQAKKAMLRSDSKRTIDQWNESSEAEAKFEKSLEFNSSCQGRSYQDESQNLVNLQPSQFMVKYEEEGLPLSYDKNAAGN